MPAENAARRTRILNAAVAAFCEEGFGRTSMDRVARQAGVSKATLYKYFPSKQVLFEAVVSAVSAQFVARVVTPERLTQPLAEALEQIALDFLGTLLARDNLAAVRLIIGEVQSNPDIGRLFYRAGPEQALRAVSRFFRSRQEAGELPGDDPDFLARQFVAAFRGDIYWQALLGLDMDAPARAAHVRRAVVLFLRGLGVV
ncbi:TetR/AcrR family transcriptional regulator [Hahella sp. SMD15-11]|uniref:TetR/AcrR family transcriptional regulator n=1 Tax=Thermohahella caldifontis TaxID=3142973 RepID=A0AB39UVL9_9GAMM